MIISLSIHFSPLNLSYVYLSAPLPDLEGGPLLESGVHVPEKSSTKVLDSQENSLTKGRSMENFWYLSQKKESK